MHGGHPGYGPDTALTKKSRVVKAKPKAPAGQPQQPEQADQAEQAAQSEQHGQAEQAAQHDLSGLSNMQEIPYLFDMSNLPNQAASNG